MKSFSDKVLLYMMEEWEIDYKSMRKGVDKGLFSIIKKDEMSSESVQESAKNGADFVKSINDENENEKANWLKILFSFIRQGGPHMPFKS